MAMMPRQPAPQTGPSVLAYRQPGLAVRNLVRPRQYLSDLVMTGGLVGILVLAMAVVGRLHQVFLDFHMKLPWITAAILVAHVVYNRLFLWLAVWLVPVVAPLLLGQANRRWRRWAYFAAFAVVAVIVVLIVLGMMLPLTTLLEGISSPTKK
jgi:type II secretory pathway component PulF